jgi:hypothetical protein
VKRKKPNVERLQRFARAFQKLPQEQREGPRQVLEHEREMALEKWAKDPYLFLTATDPLTGRPIIWTKDERDRHQPVKPFPANKPHLQAWIEDLQAHEIILCDKTRQLMFSTATLLYGLHQCAFVDARRYVLSKQTQEGACEMIADKLRFPVSRMPEWLRKWIGVSEAPEHRVKFKRTGSLLVGVPENVADRAARGITASCVIIDEAARQPFLERIFAACIPLECQIIAITTAELGNPGASFFLEMLEREERT